MFTKTVNRNSPKFINWKNLIIFSLRFTGVEVKTNFSISLLSKNNADSRCSSISYNGMENIINFETRFFVTFNTNSSVIFQMFITSHLETDNL